MSNLVDLTLSHNYLSGEIPSWLLEKQNMNVLDLSHNKLTGDLDRMRMRMRDDENMTNHQRTLKLTVNRLSGGSPPSLNDYWSLDILSGNVFGCENIPSNDENSQYYVCGSSEYNRSMLVFVGVVVLLLLWMMTLYFLNLIIVPTPLLQPSSHNSDSSFSFSFSSFFFSMGSCLRRCCEKNVSFFNRMMKYHRFYLYNNVCSSTGLSLPPISTISTRTMSNFNHFGESLVATQKLFIITTIIIILSSIPLYVVKNVENKSFVTHYHQYQWYFTISYFSGSIPGVMLLIYCLISVFVFRMTLWKLNCNKNEDQCQYQDEDQDQGEGSDNQVKVESQSSIHSSLSIQSNEVINTQFHSHTQSTLPLQSSSSINTETNSNTTQSVSVIDWLYLCLISFLNLVIVGTVNGLYIWSTLQDLSNSSRLMIQLSVSLFGVVWKVILRSIFPSRVKNSFSGMWLLSVIGVLNGVIIPCLVTSFTSPTCYQVSKLID